MQKSVPKSQPNEQKKALYTRKDFSLIATSLKLFPNFWPKVPILRSSRFFLIRSYDIYRKASHFYNIIF